MARSLEWLLKEEERLDAAIARAQGGMWGTRLLHGLRRDLTRLRRRIALLRR